MNRTAIGLCLAMCLPMGGCIPFMNDVETVVLIFFASFGGQPKFEAPPAMKAAKFAKKVKVSEEFDQSVTVTIGGLSGTFEIEIGEYGTIEGTATIKGQKKARTKIENDAEVNALCERIIEDRTGTDVHIGGSKVIYKGSQTTGGVKRKYNCTIKFDGIALDGPRAGERVKGKFKTKGKFE